MPCPACAHRVLLYWAQRFRCLLVGRGSWVIGCRWRSVKGARREQGSCRLVGVSESAATPDLYTLVSKPHASMVFDQVDCIHTRYHTAVVRRMFSRSPRCRNYQVILEPGIGQCSSFVSSSPPERILVHAYKFAGTFYCAQKPNNAACKDEYRP